MGVWVRMVVGAGPDAQARGRPLDLAGVVVEGRGWGMAQFEKRGNWRVFLGTNSEGGVASGKNRAVLLRSYAAWQL